MFVLTLGADDGALDGLHALDAAPAARRRAGRAGGRGLRRDRDPLRRPADVGVRARAPPRDGPRRAPGARTRRALTAGAPPQRRPLPPWSSSPRPRWLSSSRSGVAVVVAALVVAPVLVIAPARQPRHGERRARAAREVGVHHEVEVLRPRDGRRAVQLVARLRAAQLRARRAVLELDEVELRRVAGDHDEPAAIEDHPVARQADALDLVDRVDRVAVVVEVDPEQLGGVGLHHHEAVRALGDDAVEVEPAA